MSSTILHKALKFTENDVKIIRVVHKSGANIGSSLIKIELENPDEVKLVGRNKSMLRNSSVKELRDVFLRPSKCEETLVVERNIDLILNDMGV